MRIGAWPAIAVALFAAPAWGATPALKGYGGVSFHCAAPIDEFLDRLCSQAFTDARFLATTSKTPFKELRQLGQTEPRPPSAIELLVRIETSQPLPNGIRAIAIMVEAFGVYAGPVGPMLMAPAPQATNPAVVKLVLWEEMLLFATTPSETARQSINRSIEESLKRFFTDYLQAQ